MCVNGFGFDPQARLAQSVERKALNLVVVGSSPTVGVLCFLYSPSSPLLFAPTPTRFTPPPIQPSLLYQYQHAFIYFHPTFLRRKVHIPVSSIILPTATLLQQTLVDQRSDFLFWICVLLQLLLIVGMVAVCDTFQSSCWRSCLGSFLNLSGIVACWRVSG